MPRKVKRMNKRLFLGGLLAPIYLGCISVGIYFFDDYFPYGMSVIPFLAGEIIFVVWFAWFRRATWLALYNDDYYHYGFSKKSPRPWHVFDFVERFGYYPDDIFVSRLSYIGGSNWVFASHRSSLFPHFRFLENYEKYVRRYDLKVPSFNRSIYKVYHILVITGLMFSFFALLSPIFLVLMIFFLILSYVAFLITVSITCDAVNALADAEEKKAPVVS